MINFSNQLRKLRERRHISRRVLSELCGLSKNMIAIYERGDLEPTASVVIQIANYFDVSTDYLLGREENF
ncbi:MAG: helix-turn-helix transcriptional regulator [Pseudoflavonifractor sp.]|nr:helix-turn-helix transcriptional regulator [Pseudoflavonifractor sp.]